MFAGLTGVGAVELTTLPGGKSKTTGGSVAGLMIGGNAFVKGAGKPRPAAVPGTLFVNGPPNPKFVGVRVNGGKPGALATGAAGGANKVGAGDPDVIGVWNVRPAVCGG